MKRIFLIIVILAIFGSICVGQKIRVKLSVSSPDRTISADLNKRFQNELRKITDINLVDELNVFELEVIAMEIKTSKNIFIGYALSTVVYSKSLCKPLLSSSDEYKPIDSSISHSITLTDKSKIDSDVKSIVNYFNSKLNPMRNEMKTMKIKINK